MSFFPKHLVSEASCRCRLTDAQGQMLADRFSFLYLSTLPDQFSCCFVLPSIQRWQKAVQQESSKVSKKKPKKKLAQKKWMFPVEWQRL